ncbi:MAG: MFS transporter, partial [Actinomycetota bacterium]|nr:MFS transporter [Actinomycetota bacterium]
MLTSLRRRLGESLRVFAGVFYNEDLRRLELAWSGSIIGQWGYEVALAVFAYRAGGATAVGLVVLVRFLPAAVVAPFAALLGDRFRRKRIMVAADLVRACAMAGAAAAVFGGAPAATVYALAVITAVTGTAFQPAQSALLPSLARSADELTAANATSTTLESLAFFVGPALGGLLLAVTSVGAVFTVTAAMFLWSALVLGRIDADSRGGPRIEAESILREALAGFRAIAVESRLRLLVGLYGAQTLAAGILRVLLVVTALQILDLGPSGVGLLNSAVGVGALAGLLVVVALITSRLSAVFGLGILLWGVPLALLGIWPSVAAALVLLGILGIGNILVDVAGLTLLQRAAPDEVRARVFGVLESVFLGTIGIGAILAPLLTAALGARGALIAAGGGLSVLVLLFWRPLTAVDALAAVPESELSLLRGVPIFAPLPLVALEQLASRLSRVRVAAGDDVFRRGDPGDRFYLIGEGEVAIALDGPPVTLGPGAYFGEIALLRDVPRTATVTARTEVELYALEGDVFIAAVTGHAPSAEAADAVIASRLGSAGAGAALRL